MAIDLYAGLGGWTEGLLAEGYNVVGFDIERHQYGDQKYPAQLVLQNVLTVHGGQFKDATLIVASPPCQAYSYMAMPWSRAKAIAAEYRSGVRSVDDLNALFNACFRIQREACEAAGRYIPMVVENVKGAQPWVGPAKAHYGSFYLWGDVEMVGDRIIAGGLRWDSIRAAKRGAKNGGGGSWFAISHGVDSGEMYGANPVRGEAVGEGVKNTGGSWFAIGSPGQTNVGQNPDGRKVRFTSRDCGVESTKNGNDWFGSGADCSLQRKAASGSSARKAASAQIAKIPLPLSSYIARAYRSAL